jgi:ABC-type glycerol-3-phosphate transport system substrate-binding protein
MSGFKTILLAVFIGATVLGVLVFSGIINIGGRSASVSVEGSVTLWGTFSNRDMSPLIQDYNIRNQKIPITYVEKNPATFADELVEALARGVVPDLVILPDNLINRFEDKVTHISYATLPARTFADTYVSGASIFLSSTGSIGIPWATNPLVMYYNKNLLEGAGIVKIPKTWGEFSDTIPALTQKRDDMTLIQSGTALGTFANIAHAKDIIAMLFLQTGNLFISNGIPVVPHFGLTSITSSSASVGTEALNFFTAFSNPVNDVYSWNAGQPLDRDAFTRSSLAYYFGTASELPVISSSNPNLRFDVALPPQSAVNTPSTTGRVYAVVIPRSAQNQLLSYTAALAFTNTESTTALVQKAATTLALMPARRDVLAQTPASDPYLALMYRAALLQRPWFDPHPIRSNEIFASLVREITSGIATIPQALSKAASQITALSRSSL